MLQMPQNPKDSRPQDANKETHLFRLEQQSDKPAIQKMYCQAFGPGRFARTAYRIREGGDYAKNLSCVAEHQGQVAGTIRFSEIAIGEKRQALLLGPLVVNEVYRGYNYGIALIDYSLKIAQKLDFKLVILVGDLAYYQKAGFVRIASGDIRLPAPFNAHRLLAYEIEAGALQNFKGLIAPVKE